MYQSATHSAPTALDISSQKIAIIIIIIIIAVYCHLMGVGIAQSVQLRAGWPGFDSRQGQQISLLHSVQTASGAHTAYALSTGDFFSQV
jgi:hypothetical protein